MKSAAVSFFSLPLVSRRRRPWLTGVLPSPSPPKQRPSPPSPRARRTSSSAPTTGASAPRCAATSSTTARTSAPTRSDARRVLWRRRADRKSGPPLGAFSPSTHSPLSPPSPLCPDTKLNDCRSNRTQCGDGDEAHCVTNGTDSFCSCKPGFHKIGHRTCGGTRQAPPPPPPHRPPPVLPAQNLGGFLSVARQERVSAVWRLLPHVQQHQGLLQVQLPQALRQDQRHLQG